MSVLNEINELKKDVEKARYIRAHVYDRKNENIRVPLTEEEKDDLKERIARNSIIIAEANEVLSHAKAVHREAVKEPKQELKEDCVDLKDGHKLVEKEVYYVDDQKEGLMHSFDEEGNFISSRKLYPEERQYKLKVN